MTSQEHIRSRKLFVATFGAVIAMVAIGVQLLQDRARCRRAMRHSLPQLLKGQGCP